MLIKLHVTIVQMLDDLKRREEGQTLVEYGLILALIAVVVAVALGPLGNKVSQLITSVTNAL